jgi:dolichyl-phosphate-mannose-protein mannosyltransferase
VPEALQPAQQPNSPDADWPANRADWTRFLVICAALFLLSHLLFLIGIQFPRGHCFDEFHYVPAAKEWLALGEHRNWEHPPLAKLLMALSIGAWGDIPIGWRYMSTVFGGITLAGMYAWGLALFRNRRAALWVAALTLFNQLLYVQSRIGMLDTFMFAFLAWGLAAFTASWLPGPAPRVRRMLRFAGACFGLAVACKWFAIVPWLACVGLVVALRLLQAWKMRFETAGPDDWFRPGLWEGVRARDWMLALAVIPFLAYFVTFLPYAWMPSANFSLGEFFAMQLRMYDGQLRVVSAHNYMSKWTQWPLLTRPIWYAFDKEGAGQEFVRCVLLIGNPWVMLTGLAALGACLARWLMSRDRASFLILFFYCAFYFSWALIPRKVAFYYYYYPAGMVLSLAAGAVFFGGSSARGSRTRYTLALGYLGVAAAVFAYFFPILAALKLPSESFRHWMWFSSWI